MEIKFFSIGNRIYILKEPVELVLEDCCFVNDSLGIMVIPTDGIHQVLSEGQQQLADLYKAYVECPEYELSKSGKEFKKKLQDMVI